MRDVLGALVLFLAGVAVFIIVASSSHNGPQTQVPSNANASTTQSPVAIAPPISKQEEGRIRKIDALKQRNVRIEYAKSYERGLLEAGEDATVQTSGKEADTLLITFVLLNRPFVYKTQNDSELNAGWSEMGFKKVRLSDGFDSSWSYSIH